MPLEPEPANNYADFVKKKRSGRAGTGIKSTSNYFLKRNPEKYRAIVEMLGEGTTPNHIKKALHVCQSTVQAIRDQEAKTIAKLRNEYLRKDLRKARLLARNLVEDIQRRLPEMNIKEAMLAFDVLMDHVYALEAQLELKSTNADISSFAALLERLPSSADKPE
jgi:hypothetical protein